MRGFGALFFQEAVMRREERQVYRDTRLGLESVSFHGVMQPFANHFHEYYVIGSITDGSRRMGSQGRAYGLGPGDLVLFAPGDTHACETLGNAPFTYYGFNIKAETMRAAWEGISVTAGLPSFGAPLAHDAELAEMQRDIAEGFRAGEQVDGTRDRFTAFLGKVAARYCVGPDGKPEESGAVEAVCAWMRRHYAEPLTLAQLGAVARINKYTLLRAFVKTKGITPHRYLETLRVAAAGALLEQGGDLAYAAAHCGFADQSHLTRHFKRMTGLTPGQYKKPLRKGIER